MSSHPSRENDMQNLFKYIRDCIIPFLKENGDRRISKETMTHYKNFAISKPVNEEIVLSEAIDNNVVKSISLATIKNGSDVKYSVTVTAKEFRQQGFGTKALNAKLGELKRRGMGIKTIVAEDNDASMALCARAGLVLVEKIERTRSTGPFMACIFVDPPTKVES